MIRPEIRGVRKPGAKAFVWKLNVDLALVEVVQIRPTPANLMQANVSVVFLRTDLGGIMQLQLSRSNGNLSNSIVAGQPVIVVYAET